MQGFKGFDKNLKCRDFQYEIGGTYEHDGALSLCASGFHFCENPLDVFTYYTPADSRFAKVTGENVSDQKESDSKRVAAKLQIGAELSLTDLCNAGAKFILDRADFKNAKESNTGYQSAATNTGNYSAATNTGKEGFAIATGYQAKARGAVGCWLVLAEWEQKPDGLHIENAKIVKVDGKRIKADTFYTLKNGKFVKTS